jgi:hypothetical protein
MTPRALWRPRQALLDVAMAALRPPPTDLLRRELEDQDSRVLSLRSFSTVVWSPPASSASVHENTRSGDWFHLPRTALLLRGGCPLWICIPLTLFADWACPRTSPPPKKAGTPVQSTEASAPVTRSSQS